MIRSNGYLKTQKGFTLIELLVVIAIIALLLAIVMPALNKAKRFAEEIMCKSNLHQYQLATEMYCNENNDRMPDPWESLYSKDQFAGESQRYCRWHNPEYDLGIHADQKDSAGNRYAGPYWPYLAVTKANVCPLFAKLATKYAEYHMEGNGSYTSSDCIGGPFTANFSYSMNSIFYRDDNGTITTLRRSQIGSPSQTFLWAEENMWVLSGLSSYVLNDNALHVGTGGSIDCFGSFHKISTAQLNIQQSTHKYESGVSNVLMLDGSLSVLSPTDSVKYRGRTR